MLVGNFYSDVWMPHQETRLRACTLDGYRRKWERHIAPAWAGVELDRVTAEGLERWLAAIPTAGAMHSAWAVMRSMLRRAERWGYASGDPTRRVEVGQRPLPPKRRLLTTGEIRLMLVGYHGHPLEPWALVSGTLGLRREEACGLRWSDLDLRSGRVEVRRALQSVAGRVVEVDPKTPLSSRDLWLPGFARRRLAEVKRGLSADGRRGRLVGGLAPDAVARRHLSHCRAEGLPWVPPMYIRHSWATSMLAAGVDVAVVSRMLGHADISTTVRYYLRPDDEVMRAAQAVWERALMRS